MNDIEHLRSYFPDYLSTDSLFTKMSVLGAPWTSDVGQDMDDAYFTMYSGVKNPSEFVKLHLNPNSDTANSLTIARVLYGIYGKNWTKLWNALTSEYNPLNDYSIIEDTTRNTEGSRTINKDIDTTSSSSDTNTTDYGETIATTSNNKSYNFGFNSTTGVPTDEHDGTGTEDHDGTDTVTSTGSNTSTTSDDTSDKSIEDETISRTRKGNIGQNTYQELIRQEFELWRWNFFTRVFDDVDKFLTLSVYTDCPVHSSVN